MNGTSIRVIDLSGSPDEMGRAHGEAYAEEIRDYAGDRTARSADGTGWDRDQILALGRAMLPAHRRYSVDLYAEMNALAEAAGISPEEALIVGGYTDFIDTVRSAAGGGPIEDNCTAVMVPDGWASGAGFLAQTWDMHASATPHIVMLRLAPRGRPHALVFTTVGCLGQIGMNEAGVAIGINNLTAADGQIGVTWPFVVRKALEQSDVDSALKAILDVDLAGGHNFLLFDSQSTGYSVEAMPTARHVFKLDEDPFIHTNHCLAPSTQAVEGARPPELQASSTARLDLASKLMAGGLVGVEDLMALTRDERSICRRPQPPFDYESCGAAIMRPATGDFWAVWGVPSENDYEHYRLGGSEWVS